MSSINSKFAQALLPLLTTTLLATACSDSTAPASHEGLAPGAATADVVAAAFPENDTAILQVPGGYSRNVVTWYSDRSYSASIFVDHTTTSSACASIYVRLRYADGTSTIWTRWSDCGSGPGVRDNLPRQNRSKAIYQAQFKLVVGSATDYYNVSPGGQ